MRTLPLSSIPLRTLVIPLLLALLGAGVVACKKKPPAAPPEFADPNRAPTGDTSLEVKILEAMDLERATDVELEAMHEDASKVAAEDVLSRYVAALIGRGRSADAIKLLFERAWRHPGDEVKRADAFGLTMGMLRWSTCEQMARSFLDRKLESEIFLLRALCLQRSGKSAEVESNLVAAHDLDPLQPEVLTLIREQLATRGSPTAMSPASDDVYNPLVRGLSPRGVLSRLFLAHLTGRFESDLHLGSLDFGELTALELRKVVQSRARSYRHCYSLALAQSKGKKLAGSTEIEWEVGPLGAVQNIRTANSDWGGHPQAGWMEKCLIDQVSKLRFPRPQFGLPVPARHRFAYQPD